MSGSATTDDAHAAWPLEDLEGPIAERAREAIRLMRWTDQTRRRAA
jgi:hypothetical protein